MGYTAIIDDEGKKYCYRRFHSCKDDAERQMCRARLALQFDCCDSTIRRAIQRGGPPRNVEPENDADFGPVEYVPPRKRGRPPKRNVASARAVVRRTPARALVRTRERTVAIQSRPSDSQSRQPTTPQGSASRPTGSQNHTLNFASFLYALELGKLVAVFSDYGFSSQKDLDDLRGASERVKELTLKEILRDRRISLADWMRIYSALDSDHRRAA